MTAVSVPSRTLTSVADEMDLPFWEGAVQCKLLVQRCKDCNRYYWPVSICVQCSNRDLEWVEATGRSAVHTLTVIHRLFLLTWAANTPIM